MLSLPLNQLGVPPPLPWRLGDHFGVLGESEGSPLESPRAPKMLPKFLGESLERLWSVLGELLGWFWRSGVLLGSVLGGQNVVIFLVLDGFLGCHVF